MGLFGKKTTEEKKSAAKNDGKTVKDSGKKEKKTDKGASMKDLYAQTDTKDKAPKAVKAVKEKKIYGSAHRVLVKPLITEKAANVGVQNKYVFEVDTKANKIEIAKAVHETYGIKPIDVNIIRTKGKKVRYGRMFGQRKNWKKAIVSLPKGQTINIYEGV
jgi:large subunit ribosomal protein L23